MRLATLACAKSIRDPLDNGKICITDPFTLLFGHNNPAAYWISERAYLKDENRESIQYCSSSARSQFLLYDRRLPVLNLRVTAKVSLA